MVRGERFGEKRNLSLAQWCEEMERARVLTTMSSDERLFIESNCGPGSAWVRATPLTWMNWDMKPRLWVVAARRRLYQQVCPRRGICIACQMGRIDTKGEHQVTCAGRAGLIMRHDSIKYLLRQELENAGYKTELQKNASSQD